MILFYGWTIGAIFLLSIITFIIYLKIKEKSFLYYSLYAFFLSFYITIHATFDINDFLKVATPVWITLINWPVQFIFYLLYAQFIRTFFDLKNNNPNLDKYVVIFMIIMFSICLIFSLLNILVLSDSVVATTNHFVKFVVYFYIPFFVPFAFYALYKINKSSGLAKSYIIIGSTIYILSALISMYFSVTRRIPNPLIIFMSGVLIESFFFAIALAIKIYQISQQKNEYQKKLIDQLETNKKLVEHNNQILTNKVELFTKKEIELEFKNSLNKLKSKVFRSQVNSHFIFNILNSIKGTIINDHKEKSVDLINKFSKLIRNIINHSLEEEVTLEKEIEITELYVHLENLRFNNEISFNLNIDTKITSVDTLKIPPFIIQPFIENAIWHGLANKTGTKKLEVSITTHEEKLKITIIDNGIGIIQSMQIKKKKNIQHKSVGIDITRERLALFAQNCNQNYSLILENIGTENNSKGTKVSIELPYKA